MICPRCESETVELMTKSPIEGAWEVYICDTCTYSWRSTETPDKTDPKQYKASFKIKPASIPSMLVIPPVPPLREK